MPIKKYFSREEKAEAKRIAQARYRKKNPEKIKESHSTWRQKNITHIKEKQHEYYLENSEEILSRNRAYMRRQRIEDPAAYKIMLVRSRAKRLGLEFDLEESDIVIPEKCPILGTPITPAAEGRATATSWALDRIDNTRSYVKGNVRVISHRANTLKNDLTPEICERLLRYMKGEL